MATAIALLTVGVGTVGTLIAVHALRGGDSTDVAGAPTSGAAPSAGPSLGSSPTAPHQTETQGVPATRPHEAVRLLLDAWVNKDRGGAAQYAVSEVVAALFARQPPRTVPRPRKCHFVGTGKFTCGVNLANSFLTFTVKATPSGSYRSVDVRGI